MPVSIFRRKLKKADGQSPEVEATEAGTAKADKPKWCIFKRGTKGQNPKMGNPNADTPQWDADRLPEHIAIVLDGNGRWAARRALPRRAGHAAGAETFRRVATYCKDIGIKWLTVYAFSTENWKRSEDEISAIMELLEKYLYESIEKMERDRVKLKFLGDTTILSPKLQELIAKTEALSKTFQGVQVNICLNYGSRDEIMRAAKRFAKDIASGNLREEDLTEDVFSEYLYTAGIPDPDLVIRPSGENRLSNYLLWQSAYSEFYFTDVLWPDFNEREMDKAIIEYQKRERRFGGRSGASAAPTPNTTSTVATTPTTPTPANNGATVTPPTAPRRRIPPPPPTKTKKKSAN